MHTRIASKRGSTKGDGPGHGLYVSLLQHRPLLVLMMPARTLGSMPSLHVTCAKTRRQARPGRVPATVGPRGFLPTYR